MARLGMISKRYKGKYRLQMPFSCIQYAQPTRRVCIKEADERTKPVFHPRNGFAFLIRIKNNFEYIADEIISAKQCSRIFFRESIEPRIKANVRIH